MTIPLRNIFLMLAYAARRPEAEALALAGSEDTDVPVDYLAIVLCRGMDRILRRGLDREYSAVVQRTDAVRGRIKIDRLARRDSRIQRGIECEFDQHSPDNLHNQIVAATLQRLIGTIGLHKVIRKEAKRTLQRMPSLSDLNLRSHHFGMVRLHRNNRLYRLPIAICQLLFQSLTAAPDSADGWFRMVDIRRDERVMGNLFEDFLREFLRREQDSYLVERPQIKWAGAMSHTGPDALDRLPTMQTDMVLKARNRHVIVDAKYTRSPITAHHGGTPSLRSEHLYQILTYASNYKAQVAEMEAIEATLLYARVDESIEYDYRLNEIPLHIRSVDLSQPWEKLRTDILQAVDAFSGDGGAATVA